MRIGDDESGRGLTPKRTPKAIREGKGGRELLDKERLQDDRRNFEESLKDARDRLAVAIIARDEEASKVDIQEANKELRGSSTSCALTSMPCRF